MFHPRLVFHLRLVFHPGLLRRQDQFLGTSEGAVRPQRGRQFDLEILQPDDFVAGDWVTTVPAAGYVAVGLVLGEWSQVWGSAIQVLINLVGIVVAAASMLEVRTWVHQRYVRKGATTAQDRWRRAAFRG